MKTILKQANDFLLKGQYERASKFYEQVLEESPEMERFIQFNLKLVRNATLQRIKKIFKNIGQKNHKEKLFTPVVAGDEIILFISHDASLTGAPAVLLEVARYLALNSKYSLYFLIGGEYTDRIDEFKKIGECLHVADITRLDDYKIKNFLGGNIPYVVYSNTVVAALLMQFVKNIFGEVSTRYITHIHERKGVLNNFLSEAKYVLENSDEIIAVSNDVAKEIGELNPKRKVPISVIPPIINPANLVGNELSCFDFEGPLVFGCGTIESRKGFDLFCAAISAVAKSGKSIRGVWIGSSPSNNEPAASLRKYHVEDLIQVVGTHSNPRSFYRAGDIFFMSSREDPFPLVCLEAAECGLSVLCFDEKAGGSASFVRESKGGLVCRYLDIDDAAYCLALLLDNEQMRREMGQSGSVYVRNNYYPEIVMPNIMTIISSPSASRSSRLIHASKKLSVLVVSFGPAPILGIKQVEGGGLRSWGLANSLVGFDSYEVTFDFPKWYLNDSIVFLDSVNGVNIRSWADSSDLIDHIKDYDIIIASYCYGSYTDDICDSINWDKMLILDCYVPIYVEVSARRSKDRINEYRSYLSDSQSWNKNLSRGDLLLCANEAQRLFYLGVLYSNGVNNPINYEYSDNIVTVPFGFDAKRHEQVELSCFNLSGKNEPIKLLWFGGVYPWFDIASLINAVKIVRKSIPCVLTIVGARNPYNSHPDFIAISQRVQKLASSEEFSDFVFLDDWVDYERRLEWYKNADLLITLNQPGTENFFAWRTRVVDYLASGIRFATNGGDQLSEKLIEIGLASRIDSSSEVNLATTLETAIRNIGSNQINYEALAELRSTLSWESTGEVLKNAIDNWWATEFKC